MRDRVKVWAQEMSGVLHTSKVEFAPTDIQRVIRGPRTLTYAMRLQKATDLDKVRRLEDALALAMSVKAVRVSRLKGLVNIEVGLPSALQRDIYLRDVDVKRGMYFTPGKTVLNTHVNIRLGGPILSHGIVGGATGCGKTNLLHVLLIQLMTHHSPERVQIVIVDGKGGKSYQRFKNAQHLKYMATTPQEGLNALAYVLKELGERKTSTAERPYLFLVIDEIRELIQLTGGTTGQAAAAIERITSTGREYRIIVMAATQYVRKDVLGGRIAESNMRLRIGGAVSDVNASNLIMGDSGTGAHRLLGRGDFLVGKYRFQAPLPQDVDYAAIPQNGHVSHTPPTLDLSRLLTVTGGDERVGPDPSMLSWAICDYLNRQEDAHPPHAISANAIRKEFGIGMDKAREVRDYAQAIFDGIEGQF